jgi:hypothetical protein
MVMPCPTRLVQSDLSVEIFQTYLPGVSDA